MKRECSILGCYRPHKGRGYCAAHLAQANRGTLDREMLPFFDAEGRRRCGSCGRYRELKCFPPSLASRGGHGGGCYECRKIKSHGLTWEQFNELLAAQGGVCAICQYPCGRNPSLSIDHDHNCCPGKKSCGKCVRGLLCDYCNTGLGKFSDRIDRLQAAINYLKENQ